jgi:hypothetical protein
MGNIVNVTSILAEIERLWSAAEKVLSPARFSTHPTLLESILFSSSAIKLVKEEDSSKRYDGFRGNYTYDTNSEKNYKNGTNPTPLSMLT